MGNFSFVPSLSPLPPQPALDSSVCLCGVVTVTHYQAVRGATFASIYSRTLKDFEPPTSHLRLIPDFSQCMCSPPHITCIYHQHVIFYLLSRTKPSTGNSQNSASRPYRSYWMQGDRSCWWSTWTFSSPAYAEDAEHGATWLNRSSGARAATINTCRTHQALSPVLRTKWLFGSSLARRRSIQ